MRQHLLTWVLGLSFLLPIAAPAQTPAPTNASPQSFVRTFAYDEWTMFSSPFRKSSYSTRAVKKYVIPFAVVTAALIATDRKTADLLPNSRDQAVWSGRVSQFGAAYSLAGGAGAMYLIGKATHDRHASETGWLGLEAIAHTQVLTFGIKQATNRHRPTTDEIGRGFWNGGDSFPSGHAATSFALAAVVSYEYRDHIAVPIAAYSLATLVSVSRVSARRHWASDIVAGGSMGFLVGRYIYRRHHDPNLPGTVVRRGALDRLVPEFGFSRGPSASWRF
jgi:membrane-associated phospholipid phosphatase